MNFTITNISLVKQLNQLIEECDDIEEIDYDLEYEIETLKEDIRELSNNISQKNKQLSKLKKEYTKTNNKFNDLKQKKEDCEKKVHELKSIEFRDFILSVNEKNTMSKHLFTDTATTTLLDTFCESNKHFLLFKKIFYTDKNSVSISLIMTGKFDNITAEKSRPTMTEIKQNAGKHLDDIDCKRLLPLVNEIKKIDKTNRNLEIGKIFPFETPFLIGGQIGMNRKGYGWKLGKLYGDVTEFMIVGVLIENRYPYY